MLTVEVTGSGRRYEHELATLLVVKGGHGVPNRFRRGVKVEVPGSQSSNADNTRSGNLLRKAKMLCCRASLRGCKAHRATSNNV